MDAKMVKIHIPNWYTIMILSTNEECTGIHVAKGVGAQGGHPTPIDRWVKK